MPQIQPEKQWTVNFLTIKFKIARTTKVTQISTKIWSLTSLDKELQKRSFTSSTILKKILALTQIYTLIPMRYYPNKNRARFMRSSTYLINQMFTQVQAYKTQRSKIVKSTMLSLKIVPRIQMKTWTPRIRPRQTHISIKSRSSKTWGKLSRVYSTLLKEKEEYLKIWKIAHRIRWLRINLTNS